MTAEAVVTAVVVTVAVKMVVVIVMVVLQTGGDMGGWVGAGMEWWCLCFWTRNPMTKNQQTRVANPKITANVVRVVWLSRQNMLVEVLCWKSVRFVC